jgi:hypothetical protein
MVDVRRISIGMAALLIIGATHWFTGRSGLFNNRLDPDAAMTSHKAAWSQLSCQGEFFRLCMHSILREYGGSCITEEDVWETVHMDQRLDHVLKRPGMLIGCHVDVRGRLPFDLFGAYRWTTVLEPVSPNQVRLREFRRGKDKL